MSTDIQTSQTLGISKASSQPHTPTSSPYHSPVLVSRLQEMVADLKTRVQDFGMKRKGSLAYFCRDTWLLKTPQQSLLEGLDQFSKRLPSSGIMQNGHIYPAINLGFNNAVSDFILLPTPIKTDSKAPHGRAHYFGNLRKGRGYALPTFIRDGEKDGIYPNPELTEALMTFPVGYTDLQVLEMPSYP